MSIKRNIKDLSLDINEDQETKELTLEKKPENIRNPKLTKEDYLKSPTPDSGKKKKPIDSSIYSRKSEKKKWTKKKKWWVWGSVGTTISLALGLGLGLGLGLRKHYSEDDAVIINPMPGDDDLIGWIEDQITETNEYKEKQLEVKKDLAIIWKFEQFIDNNDFENMTEAKIELETSNNRAKEIVDNKKDELKDQFGDSWKEEFDTFLFDSGYDNEDEYFKASQSSILLEYMSQAIYLDESRQLIYMKDIKGEEGIKDVTIKDDFIYHSSEIKRSDEKDYKKVLDTGKDENPMIPDGIDPDNPGPSDNPNIRYRENQNPINFEDLFTLFLFLEKPVAIESVNSPFTWTNDENPYQPAPISWSSTDDLKNFFFMLKRMGNIEWNTSNPSSIDDAESLIDFYGDEHVSSYNGGLQNLSTFSVGSEDISNAMFLSLINNNTDYSTKIIHENKIIDDVKTQTGLFSLVIDLLDAIKNSVSISGLFDKIDNVKPEHFNIISEKQLEEIGINFYEKMLAPGGKVDKLDTLSSFEVKSEQGVGFDKVYFSWNNTGFNLWRNAFMIKDEYINNAEGMITWEYKDVNDHGQGKQWKKNNIDFKWKYDDTMKGLPTIGWRMMVDVLNKKVNNKYYRASINTGIYDSFNTWLEKNIENIIFNDLLLGAKENEKIEEEYFEYEDSKGVKNSIYNDLVNIFYNKIYQSDQTGYIETYAKITRFYDENENIFNKFKVNDPDPDPNNPNNPDNPFHNENVVIDEFHLKEELEKILLFLKLNKDFEPEENHFVAMKIDEIINKDGKLIIEDNPKGSK